MTSYSMQMRLLTGCLLILASCAKDIPECPTRMCIMAGGWQLTEAFIDNERYAEDLSLYDLVLHFPDPADSEVSTYDRTHISGTFENGTWSVLNDETILQLDPNSAPPEDWIIQTLTPRRMILVMERDDDIKQGPSSIRLVLERY